jgi:hypothetical protein
MTPTKQVLRWVAVLPGAVLGGFIVLFPVHWAAMLIHYFGPFGDPIITTEEGKGLLQAMPLESLERFGDALFVPGAIVAMGARIAPRFHLVTGIVLTVLFIALMSFVLFGTGMQLADSTFRTVITIILWLASLTFALFHARELDQGA